MHLQVGWEVPMLRMPSDGFLWRNARWGFTGMLPCMFVTIQKSGQKARFLASGELSKHPAPSFQSIKASRKCAPREYQQTLSKTKRAPKAAEPQNRACGQLLCYCFSSLVLISSVLVQFLVYHPKQSHQQYNIIFLLLKVFSYCLVPRRYCCCCDN